MVHVDTLGQYLLGVLKLGHCDLHTNPFITLFLGAT